MRKQILGAAALAICTVVGSAASHADLFGSIWTGVPGAASDATVAQAAGLGAPNATFTATAATGLNFFSPDSTLDTVSGFLASGGVTCTGAGCGDTLNDSYFLITNAPGFLATAPGGGSGFATVIHDDGVQLAGSIDGLILDAPDPTGPVADFGFLSGPQSIQLAYGECCGGPAVLISDLGQTPVPEPASLAILGTVLVGFGVMRRRRKS